MHSRLHRAFAPRHACGLARRAFLAELGVGAAGWAILQALGLPTSGAEPPKKEPYALMVVEGSPRERGRKYGEAFAPAIRDFLVREIYAPFAKDQAQREELLRYAGECAKEIAAYSPEIADELAGLAEAAGIQPAEGIQRGEAGVRRIRSIIETTC